MWVVVLTIGGYYVRGCCRHGRLCPVRADGARLAELLSRTATGELPARVQAVVPLDRVADAHRAVAESGVRGRYVLRP